MENVESLLKKLISVPSITSEELKFCDFLFNYLVEKGYHPEKVPVDSNGYNILVKEGNPKIYLSAHIDTVAPYIPFSQDSQSIYGRGSCDTKGCMASMLMAGHQAKQAGLSNFGFIFTIGEESDFRGVTTMTKTNLNIPFVIVGEPTSLDIVNGHFGILIISLTAMGKTAHSSAPEQGINAINLLVKGLSLIHSNLTIYNQTLMNVAKINGGTADNIVPDRATALISFRVSPQDKINYAKAIQKIVGNTIKVDVIDDYPSIFSQIPKELKFITKSKTVKYMTELSMFKNGVVLGPGDIKYAHSANEFIPKIELNQAVEIYLQILKNFCS